MPQGSSNEKESSFCTSLGFKKLQPLATKEALLKNFYDADTYVYNHIHVYSFFSLFSYLLWNRLPICNITPVGNRGTTSVPPFHCDQTAVGVPRVTELESLSLSVGTALMTCRLPTTPSPSAAEDFEDL